MSTHARERAAELLEGVDHVIAVRVPPRTGRSPDSQLGDLAKSSVASGRTTQAASLGQDVGTTDNPNQGLNMRPIRADPLRDGVGVRGGRI